ncbi:histone-lysine N-methyltransferase EHMT1 [Nephila pilipes]|uniref:Histone-lysine N-methyltransferase EHMT1 n=1 Tax=Nephila pilipes TaxID=299642 RepID=A0A8X6P9G4_NEPPI|nr:histone-lysine N-methyltransferase EHMT1 [Nephila pilipes]
MLNTVSTEVNIIYKNNGLTTFIAHLIPDETNIDVSGSPCLTINTDFNLHVVENMDYEILDKRDVPENVLVSASVALFKIIPHQSVDQNVSLRTEYIKIPFNDSMNIQGDINCSAGYFTCEEASDGLDNKFTQTSVSEDGDMLYDIRPEK